MSVSEDDILKLMGNFRRYMEYDVKYKTKIFNDILGRYYPVETIGDVELKFIHYTDFDEAVNIWERRKRRLNYDNLLFMAYTEDEKFVDRFEKMDNYKKICFVPFNQQSDSIYYLPRNGKGMSLWEVVNGSANGQYYYYNIIDVLLGEETRNFYFAVIKIFLTLKYQI